MLRIPDYEPRTKKTNREQVFLLSSWNTRPRIPIRVSTPLRCTFHKVFIAGCSGVKSLIRACFAVNVAATKRMVRPRRRLQLWHKMFEEGFIFHSNSLNTPNHTENLVITEDTALILLSNGSHNSLLEKHDSHSCAMCEDFRFPQSNPQFSFLRIMCKKLFAE